MKKLSMVLIALSLSLLIIGALGCDKNIEPTPTPTPTSIPTAPPGWEAIWPGLSEQGKQDVLYGPEASKKITQQAISNFLNDPHVNPVLWEEWNIFDEYSASVSLSDWRQRNEYMCGLRERVIGNINQLKSITPPSELAGFWTILVGTVPFDINNSDTWAGCGALGYYLLGSLSCTSGLGGEFALWLYKQSVDKNTQAWLSLRNTCREYNIKMEWPLPRTPQWPEPNPIFNPTPHY